MSKHENIKKTIAERQETSRAIHRRIREAKGIERHELRLEKRQYGVQTRHMLLAYGRIRNTPYASIERRCVIPPSPSAIAEFAMVFGLATDLDDIKRWLEPP
jgi:hypothetical protein